MQFLQIVGDVLLPAAEFFRKEGIEALMLPKAIFGSKRAFPGKESFAVNQGDFTIVAEEEVLRFAVFHPIDAGILQGVEHIAGFVEGAVLFRSGDGGIPCNVVHGASF